MGFLPLLLLPCLIAGVCALDLAGTPLPLPSPPVSNPPPSNTSSSNPLLKFNNVPQLITCQSATFNWTYSDSATPQLILSIVTNRSVSFSNGTSATPTVNRVLSSTVDPNISTYTWHAVDVPQGWYKLYATIPAKSFNISADFFVMTGSDVSCLLSSSSASSASSSSRPSTNIAAIVGGVLGGMALLLSAAIILLLYYRRNRMDKSESRTTDSGKRGRGGKSLIFSTQPKSWDNLGSVDSHVGAVAAVKDSYSSNRLRYQNRHPVSQTSFTDSVNLPVLEYGRNPYLNGDEKEKGYSSPRDSVYKSDGARTPRSRRPSDTSSLAASTALSHVTGPPTIPEIGPPSYRSASPTQTVPGSPETGNALDLTLSSPQQPKPHRSRKATRKPVPAYDPSTDTSSSPPPPASSIFSPLQIADDPFARPLPAALIHKDSTASLDVFGGVSSAASSGHGHGHYISRSQSTSSGKDRGLAHKQSLGGFEGRPMHYLIPDMPLPQK
ncbi:hypothetical protein JOM56_012254 [Amanita muscaria]